MRLVSQNELLMFLNRAANDIAHRASQGGVVEWLTVSMALEDLELLPPDSALRTLAPRENVYFVRAAIRSSAEAGMILVGPGEHPETEDEAAMRGAPESPPPGGWDPPANLEPCPFCRGQAELRRTLRDGCLPSEEEAFAYYAFCRSCAAAGGWAKSASGAATRWNWRSA